METADVIMLFEKIDNMITLSESLLITQFILAGIITGLLVIFIFFFFLKGAD